MRYAVLRFLSEPGFRMCGQFRWAEYVDETNPLLREAEVVATTEDMRAAQAVAGWLQDGEDIIPLEPLQWEQDENQNPHGSAAGGGVHCAIGANPEPMKPADGEQRNLDEGAGR